MKDNQDSKSETKDADSSKTVLELLIPQVSVILTAIFGIIATLVGYVIGRRAKIDDLRIKHGHKHLEKLATTFEKLHGHVLQFEEFLKNNFQNFDNYQEKAESATTLPIYQENLQIANKMDECRSQLNELLPPARVYLRANFIDLFTQYLKTLQFTYVSDGGLFHDEYVEKLFENMDDPSKRQRRAQLATSIRNKFRKASI